MPPTKQQEESATLFDENMLRLLKQGGKKVVINHRDQSTGEVTQTVELVDFTAADLNAFAKRLKDVGATGALPGSAGDKLMEAAQRHGIRLGPPPPLDTEGMDAAAG